MSLGKSPSSTTTTTKSSPWSGQQPYLLAGFQDAQNILNSGGAQYYPGTTYQAPNDYQYGGIQAEANLGLQGTPVQGAANNTAVNMLNPNWLSANPGNATYNQAASGGLNQYGGMFPESMISSGAWSNQAGQPQLNSIAGGYDPAMQTLGYFGSGATASANNPYFQQMANTTAANVLPQIEGQFNRGNRLDSGLASRAVGEGLGDSIGGLAYNNYQQGLQQMMQGANSYLGNQLSAAGQLGQLGQGNIQNMLSASGLLNSQQQQNAQNQLAGASGQSGNFNTAAQNQIQQTALAPGLNQMAYQQAGALGDSGNQLQQLQQNAINDAVQRWNYNAQLPTNTLNNYMAEIQGNYGGTTTQQNPYFQNTGANILSGALGLGSLGSSLGLFGGGAAAAGGAAGGLGSLAGLLAFL